ncbi:MULTISPECIES: phosphatidylserine decarboxylase [Rhodococcus]|uniref:Phosphatidylserine decarboxylase n=2 Tax=Rhodococcus TaxID=1827 RepID=A0ABU9CSA4_9NOCA|nr:MULTISPECIES: phosphatidylserine decarboxylase [Rhodococcus]KAA0923137.1 phosphatidylserine decarboxylase [Rhodococcus sp. ANT_H53B]KZF00125.1 phosphatidylserine decarboxylase [Rhodococcus sp. EPR-147]KZF05290.1 phosphatidylserine decarboxylase [Rhodococcus sp. EPR-279]MCJ0895117.1 phosphatidylserine decarboxylase [Rhodococcus sp. ARC_M5]MCJ0979393.1 phosphatidylserine decarboxylase [Rhodococcus sp. ARC_M12]
MSWCRWALGLAAATAAPFALFVYWRTRFFFRDPHRVPPADPRAVLAPADGFVTYVKRVEAGSTAFAVKKGRTIALDEIAGVAEADSGYLIGIYMSEYSVHRNRIPISGIVRMRRHRSAAPFNKSMARVGANLLTRRTPYDVGCDYLLTNERLTVSIEHACGAVVTVTQIADLWVNRIVAHIAVGDTVERGEQYGMIRFGSQCDVFVPDALVDEITVRPGNYVFAGETTVVRSPILVDGRQPSEEER